MFKLGRKERLIATIAISLCFFAAELAGMELSHTSRNWGPPVTDTPRSWVLYSLSSSGS